MQYNLSRLGPGAWSYGWNWVAGANLEISLATPNTTPVHDGSSFGLKGKNLICIFILSSLFAYENDKKKRYFLKNRNGQNRT